MSGIRGRLDKLAARQRIGSAPNSEEVTEPRFDAFWEMQLEWTALHLLRGLEPDFTLDETDAFVTLDGRFAVSRFRLDLRGLLGPRTQEIEETIPPERWRRFLVGDEEAHELLERLLELAEAAMVPEDYETPLGNEWTQEEVDDFRGTLKPTGIFLDAKEREATRCLTWTLIHNPGARAMLSELTRRRDAFVAQEGSMPMHLPSE